MILDIINGLVSFFELLGSTITSTISFILGMFTALRNLLISRFNNLPSVFQYGIEGMIGVMLCIIIVKFIGLFTQLK